MQYDERRENVLDLLICDSQYATWDSLQSKSQCHRLSSPNLFGEISTQNGPGMQKQLIMTPNPRLFTKESKALTLEMMTEEKIPNGILI